MIHLLSNMVIMIRMFRKLLLLLILFLVLPALACNFTGFQPPQRSDEVEALRATLRAQLAYTPTPAADGASPPQPEAGGTANPGLATATPGALPTLAPGPSATPGLSEDLEIYRYTTLPGDTLPALAARFGVPVEQIVFAEPVPLEGLLPPGMPAAIPNALGELPFNGALLPDSEIVYSPTTAGFDIEQYVTQAGGYLSSYSEAVEGEVLSGAAIVRRIAEETSTNPRTLLVLLEYQSGWVSGQPAGNEQILRPMGYYVEGYTGLYKQLSLAAKMLNMGYYGWREGSLTTLRFPNDQGVRVSPVLNAGTVALQYLFARSFDPPQWGQALYEPGDFLDRYRRMFGDPWAISAQAGPLFPAELAQPPLELPFASGERWSLTAGPHVAWNTGTPNSALDFAPVTGEAPCAVSRAWVTAPAPGVIVRSENSMIALDLDGDGYEQTGWVVVFLHIAARDRQPAGTWVELDDPLGHPSCEGGRATGTHVHVARKYNGEWIAAGGPLPMVLSGWQAQAGARPYEGFLVRDGEMVTSNPGGSRASIIVR